MDKPQVESISGIPPAIAIDQTNPVRTSRSTVGTMTELNDHLKLLFARAAALFCQRCARPVQRDTADGIYADVLAHAREAGDPRLLVCFPVVVPGNFTVEEVRALLTRQGYTRFLEGPGAPALGATDTHPILHHFEHLEAAAAPAPSAAGCSSRSRRRCASGAAASTCTASTRAIHPRFSKPGAIRTSCTARTATSRTARRSRASSRSTRRSAPARAAAGSAAPSGSTTGSSFPTTPARSAAGPSSRGRPSPTRNARRTWSDSRSCAALRSTLPGASCPPRRVAG